MAACHPARFKAELLCEDLLFGSLDALSPLLADTDVRSFLLSHAEEARFLVHLM